MADALSAAMGNQFYMANFQTEEEMNEYFETVTELR